MTYTYTPQGVCSKQITIDINDDETIESISFLGGCHGNLQGISALAKGRSIDAVLRGIDCRGRGTSCPDQLANALEQIKAEL